VLDSVDRLARAANRMNDLINDLLQLSRIGRVVQHSEPVDVRALVHEVLDYLQPRLAEVGAAVEVQPDLPRILTDRVRLSEVFDNLLTNAIKYGCIGSEPRITIGSETTVDEVRFFVRDAGPGIAPEYHDRIFGLFQRLASNEEGTGVGLAIVARILQVLGGRAWVESEVQQGATFWFALPSTTLATEAPGVA
jgi:signal transduction histidine kinase